MKTKSSPSLSVMAVALACTFVSVSRTDALSVTNGDFEDLSGLTAQSNVGWYQGVPAGWTSSAVDPMFAVQATVRGNPPPAANLGQLPDFRQNVGTTTSGTRVTLKFDLGTFEGTPNVTVRITDGNSVVYATGTYNTVGNNQILTATVGAGSPVFIEFSKTGTANPWLDNVSVSTLVLNGDFADVSGLTELGGGWYAGVPAGWSTEASSEDGYEYSVIQLADSYYANLDVLGNLRGGFNPLRQTVGTVETDSNISVSFKTTSLNGNAYRVGSAIFNAADDTPLAVFTTPSPVNGVTTVTYSARGIPAGTEVYVAFWATLPAYAPGITDVTVSTAVADPTITLNSGSALELDPAQPVVSTASLVFAPGSTIKLVGTDAPTGSAVPLFSTTGSISGSPELEPAVEGYDLVGTSNFLWLRKGLVLYNGNFQNLTGLVPTPGVAGWYDGVPIGWTGNSSSYNVINWDSGNMGANIQTLGPASPFIPFYQTGGSVDSTGTVRLRFNILGFSESYALDATIFEATPGGSPATWTALAQATYDETSGSLQTLEVFDVPEGTPIAVAFWSWAGSPGIDNVGLIPDAPAGLSYSPDTISGSVGAAITPLGPPSVTGPVDIYSVSPELPAGLTIDASTGVISGIPSAPSASAVYTVTAANAGGSTTAEVTIEVAGGAYNTWAAGYSLDPSTNGAPGADPDGDGFLNINEFAFGTNPTVGNPALVRTATAGGQVVMSWMQRIDNPSAYTVQETTNLATGPWAPSAAEVQPGTGPVPPAGYEWKQISVTPEGKKFFRVTASL